MKVNKIYVRNNSAFLNKEEIMNLLEKIGIKKEIIILSDCCTNRHNLGKCDCASFDDVKDSILISFGNGIAKEGFPKKFFLRFIFSKKFRKYIEKVYFNEDPYGTTYYFKNQPFIEIKLGVIYEKGDSSLILPILSHELLHLKEDNHCEKKECFFNIEAPGDNPVFCEYHEKMLKELIEDINLNREFEVKNKDENF